MLVNKGRAEGVSGIFLHTANEELVSLYAKRGFMLPITLKIEFGWSEKKFKLLEKSVKDYEPDVDHYGNRGMYRPIFSS
jgi:hypothetical protein